VKETEAGLIVPDHAAPVDAPPSPKKLARLRRAPATFGTVDDAMRYTAALLMQQLGPLTQAVRELMQRQMAVEDFVSGECDIEEMKARIRQASVEQPPLAVPEEPETAA